MAQPTIRRNALEETRRKFRAALAWRGMTMEDFAVTATVVPYHLSQVLKGVRKSERLLGKVRVFVADFEREVCEQSVNAAAVTPARDHAA